MLVKSEDRGAPKNGVESSFDGVARAAARCVARDEALVWALGFVDSLDPKARTEHLNGLIFFGDPRILDWIERHESEIDVARRWQFLAAASGFSWNRAKLWLHRGRPLSLVALGALRETLGVSEFRFAGVEAKLFDRPPASELNSELDAYLAMDPSPNARGHIEHIRGAIAS